MSRDSFARYGVIEERYSNFTPAKARRSMERDIARSMSWELTKAIEDEGLTPESLERHASTVFDLLDIQDGRVVYDIIQGILGIMLAKNAKCSSEVRNAFGGEDYPKTLKERREAIASTVKSPGVVFRG